MKHRVLLACVGALLVASTFPAAAAPSFKPEQIVKTSGNLDIACDSAESMRKLIGHAVAGEMTLYSQMKPKLCGDIPPGRYRILSARDGALVQFASMAKPFKFTWAAREAFAPLDPAETPK
jgi:hypothetical protein